MSVPGDRIDVLAPPYFKPTGAQTTVEQAVINGGWIGGFHIWLYTKKPEPAVLLQVRSKKSRIAPGKLDVTAGGHYDVGEQGLDGLRELQEELAITVEPAKCELWGTRLFVDADAKKRERRFAMTVYIAEVNDLPIDQIIPQIGEVEGVYWVPLASLLRVLYGQQGELNVKGIDDQCQPSAYTVKRDAFYHNPDNYHLHLLEWIAFKSGLAV